MRMYSKDPYQSKITFHKIFEHETCDYIHVQGLPTPTIEPHLALCLWSKIFLNHTWITPGWVRIQETLHFVYLSLGSRSTSGDSSGPDWVGDPRGILVVVISSGPLLEDETSESFKKETQSACYCASLPIVKKYQKFGENANLPYIWI